MRSILTPPPLTPERLHDGTPILEPIPHHPWESRVVLNPAAVLIDDLDECATLCAAWDLRPDDTRTLLDAGGVCVLLYRAQGEANARGIAPSSQGLALFTPDLRLVYRHPQPVLGPTSDALYHDLGIEDARCTKIGDTYYLYYTGYGSAPSPLPPAHPGALGRVRICLATTHNFRDWILHGPVEGLGPEDDKNAALFAKAVSGGADRDGTQALRYFLLHRPMQGVDAMTIHLAEADDPAGPWTKRGAIFESYPYAEFAESWIGAGGPPLPLTDAPSDGRFLMIYHQGHFTEDRQREYDLAAALIDLHAEPILLRRIEPLMRPTGDVETRGDALLGVDNVLFNCAAYRWGDDLILPYAASDSRIFGARIGWDSLAQALGA